MSVQILRVGSEQTPVVVIDNFVQSPDDLVDQAASLAPFPLEKSNFYPGLRYHIRPENDASFAYVQAISDAVTPIINQVFGEDAAGGKLELMDASYSMVTLPPEALQPLQSKPHIDTYEDGQFAILHYLMRSEGGGTGFYRHLRTGFETLSAERMQTYLAGLESDARLFGLPAGYYSGNANGFAEIAKIEARFNRALIYPGNLLHSGLLPDGFDFSADPRRGRLTANLFVRRAGGY